jgi:DNA-binding response OmpR family regulator
MQGDRLKHLLLIEDDELIARELIANLEKNDFVVTHLKTILQTQAIDFTKFSLIIMDWNLPDGESISLVSKLRSEKLSVPILMLSANTELTFRTKAKECGVDDFLGKPFYFHELKTRIELLLDAGANKTKSQTESLQLHGIQILKAEMSVQYRGKPISLTKKEYDLLVFFMSHPNTVFSRNELLDAVWGEDIYSSPRTVDTHVLHLRKKITPELFHTVWSSGYRFSDERKSDK